MLKVPSKSLWKRIYFTSDLAPSLHNIGGAQLNIGGAVALPKRYNVTPMADSDTQAKLV